jgi:four helix bundle protein
MEICELIYKITKGFPKEEVYGLTSQMRRSAVSIPSNLAESQLRNSKNEFRQFISIALGSCGEPDTQMELAQRFGYVSNEDIDSLSGLLNEEMRILHGLRNKLLQTDTDTEN